MTPGGAIGHRKAVFTSFRTIVGAVYFQSSDLVQTPSRGTCPVRGSEEPLQRGERGAGEQA